MAAPAPTPAPRPTNDSCASSDAPATGAPIRVATIGAGAWGTTLARLIALEQVHTARLSGSPIADVTLWDHQPARAEEQQWRRENRAYLPGFPLPANLLITGDLTAAIRDRTLILLVTPAQRLREHARVLAPLLAPGSIIVCASKGLELDTHLRMTQIVQEEVPSTIAVAALSGPNLATEVAQGLPSAAVVAAADPAVAERARAALSSHTLRVYTSDDVVGVELGGALKNIIAIGVGISDGLHYGDNAKAAFMTRALAEIARLALAAGANPLTLAGLAGLGDLIATCSSPLSRNRTLGLDLAHGRPLDDLLATRHTVVEGVATTKAALQLAAALQVELPITQEIARVLFEGKPAPDAVRSLMDRDPKRELDGF